ncbi:hypothetical protein TNCV_1875531 [Trichonephila clavipes]|nr:hypothetical protein TNCV_1875531 [Trichonephila clavipes]
MPNVDQFGKLLDTTRPWVAEWLDHQIPDRRAWNFLEWTKDVVVSFREVRTAREHPRGIAVTMFGTTQSYKVMSHFSRGDLSINSYKTVHTYNCFLGDIHIHLTISVVTCHQYCFFPNKILYTRGHQSGGPLTTSAP